MPRPSPFERFKTTWRRIFFWLPAKDEETHPEHLHDHALVLAVTSPKRTFGWKQMRYAFRILTLSERRTVLAASLVAVLAFGTAGFAFIRNTSISVPVVGGTLTEALVGQPKYLNPLDSVANDVDRDLVRLIYSGLFKYEGLNVTPDLADSYQWENDGKTLHVSLRKDARFHDGDPVTAGDVQFTFESILNPDRKSPLYPSYRGVSVSLVDDSSLDFHLDKPDVNFLNKLTIGILPAHAWQDVSASNARLSDLNVKPIGSGPYRVKSFTRDNVGDIHSYTLERFDQYHGVKPFIKTVVFQFFSDRRQALDAFKSELVDTVPFVGAVDAKPFTSSSRSQDVRLELPQESIAFFNVKEKTLADKRVREALELGVNRVDIIGALDGSAEAVTGPYPFGAGTSTTADLERARQLLTDAGWVLPQNGNVRIWQPPKPKPTPPPATTSKNKKAVTIPAVPTSTEPTVPIATASSTELSLSIAVPEDPDMQTIAEALQRQWSLLGARVTVETYPTDELVRRATRERSTQIVLVNLLLGADQDLFPFWWSGQAIERGLNFSNIADRAIDDALEKTKSATSTQALAQARNQVESAIIASDAASFLIRPVQHYLISSRVHGVGTSTQLVQPAERFQDIEKWYISTGWRWK